MVTKEQAMRGHDFHYTGKHECSRTVGPRGGVTVKVVAIRATGMCKTWVRSPDRFKLPIAYGLYEHSYLTEQNAAQFHLASECPILEGKK
jgi:hypothetical protein